MSQFFVVENTTNVPSNVATTYVTNAGSATPAANILNVLGTTSAAGNIPNQFVGSGNTITNQTQISQAIASSNSSNVGLAAFNSASFTVDANGFVSLTNPFAYTQINTASSPYTALLTDNYISCDSTAGPITILLPNTPISFRQFTIKDRTGQSGINNIFVTTVGGVVTIDGATTFKLNTAFESIQLLFNNVSYEVF